jgi:hypothetical protein
MGSVNFHPVSKQGSHKLEIADPQDTRVSANYIEFSAAAA